jgi:hypothetical protein
VIRIYIFLSWIFANLVAGYLIKKFGKEGWVNYLGYIAWALVAFQGLKLIFSFLYVFRLGIFYCCVRRKISREREHL